MSQKGLIAHYRFQEKMLNVGADVIVNGSFSADASWTKGAKWTIPTPVASFDGTANSALIQGSAFTVGKLYIITLEVLTSSATFAIEDGTSILVAEATYAVGTHSVTTLAATNTALRIEAKSSGGAFDLNSVIMKPASIADLTPQGNNLSIYGASFTTDRKGLADSALSFDGVNDYGDTGVFIDTDEPFTFIGWAKVSDKTLYCPFMGANGNADSNRNYVGLRTSNYWSGLGNTQKYTVDAGAITNGVWFHFALVSDGSTGTFYIDGVSVDTSSFTGQGLSSK